MAAYAVVPFCVCLWGAFVAASCGGSESASYGQVAEQGPGLATRLPPSAFSVLPSGIRRDLEVRGCRIPQIAEELNPSGPHNVVSGAFTGAGRSDWAVLCSIRDTSRILVYPEGADAPTEFLAEAADRSYMQGLGDGRTGFSRRIGTAHPAYIRRVAESFDASMPAVLDHDGIDDYFVDKASIIHYLDGTVWLKLQGID